MHNMNNQQTIGVNGERHLHLLLHQWHTLYVPPICSNCWWQFPETWWNSCAIHPWKEAHQTASASFYATLHQQRTWNFLQGSFLWTWIAALTPSHPIIMNHIPTIHEKWAMNPEYKAKKRIWCTHKNKTASSSVCCTDCCNGSRRRGRRILSLLEVQIHIWCEILQKEKQNSVVNPKAHTHTRYLVGEECMLAQHDCLECLRSVKEHTRHADDVCPPHRSVSDKAQHATKSWGILNPTHKVVSCNLWNSPTFTDLWVGYLAYRLARKP